MAGFRPTQCVIGIAGELVKGFTTTHTQERKRSDSQITDEELQKLINGVQKEALRDAERTITWETGLPQVDVRLVHAAVTGSQIDGYPVTNPVGFRAATSRSASSTPSRRSFISARCRAWPSSWIWS